MKNRQLRPKGRWSGPKVKTLSWTQKTNWSAGYGSKCAINYDGSVIISANCGSGGYFDLQKTTNAGSTWTNIKPSGFAQTSFIDGDKDFSDIVLSWKDGGNNGNGSWSTDTGSSWVNYFNRSSCMVCDDDRSVIIKGDQYNCVYSLNSGANWTEFRPTDSNQDWTAVCCDADGSVMLAAYSTGKVYLTTNSGNNWAEVKPAGSTTKNWDGLKCSSNGSIIYATVSGGRFYKSTDTGANWTEIAPLGTAQDGYYNFDISNDGSTIICNAANSSVTVKRTYYSTDYGETWIETRPIDDNEYSFYVAISGDGSKLWLNFNGSSSYSYYGVLQ